MRALIIALTLLATPALADVAGVASVILRCTASGYACTGSTRPRAASYAAWTVSRGSVARTRRTPLPTRSPAGP